MTRFPHPHPPRQMNLCQVRADQGQSYSQATGFGSDKGSIEARKTVFAWGINSYGELGLGEHTLENLYFYPGVIRR